MKTTPDHAGHKYHFSTVRITLWSWNVPRKARMAPELLPKQLFTHSTARACVTVAVLAQTLGGFLPVRLGKVLLNNLFTPVLNSFIKTSKSQIVFSTGWSHIYIPTVSIGTNQTRAKLTLIKQWQEFTRGWMSVLTTPRTPDTFPNAKIVEISHHFPFITKFLNSSCCSLRITWKQATWPWFMRSQWEKNKITPI